MGDRASQLRALRKTGERRSFVWQPVDCLKQDLLSRCIRATLPLRCEAFRAPARHGPVGAAGIQESNSDERATRGSRDEHPTRTECIQAILVERSLWLSLRWNVFLRACPGLPTARGPSGPVHLAAFSIYRRPERPGSDQFPVRPTDSGEHEP